MAGQSEESQGQGSQGGGSISTPTVIQLAPAATVFHDTLERNYPHYPKIEDITLTPAEMVPNCAHLLHISIYCRAIHFKFTSPAFFR